MALNQFHVFVEPGPFCNTSVQPKQKGDSGKNPKQEPPRKYKLHPTYAGSQLLLVQLYQHTGQIPSMLQVRTSG